MSEKNSHKSHRSQRMPSMHSLHVFEVAARHQSFVEAAAELYVTHGAVSRQIRQLEESLGLDLFERRNRAVFLNDQGRRLFETCTWAMSQIRSVVDELSGERPQLPLVLSCEPTVAMRWLIPRLSQFHDDNPDIQIHLMTGGGPIDFVRDKVDIALRRSDFKWPEHLHVERIAPEMMGPVCTSTVAKNLTQKSTLNSTLKAQKSSRELQSRSRPHAWSTWRRNSGIALNLSSSDQFEHFYLSLQAASAGLGVAMGSIYMVEDDLRDGRLTAPYGFAADGSEYVLLSPKTFDGDSRRYKFLEWVRYEMQKTRFKL